MSQEMKNIVNELLMFQSYITIKLLNKFGIVNKDEEWGWFIDPEINLYKPTIVKHCSTLATIQEENLIPKIRSMKSIQNLNNLHYEMNQKNVIKQNNENTNKYITVVCVTTLISLIYILIIL
jgi:hypothetical protein